MAALRVVAAFDESTLAQIAKLDNWEVRFNSHVMDGLALSAEAVRGEAEVYMWATFMNPTGQIEDSLQNQVISPTQSQVWTEEPYGARLNYGFSGKTDSLGRHYLEWPSGSFAGGYHWAELARDTSVSQVQAIFAAEMEACANGS